MKITKGNDLVEVQDFDLSDLSTYPGELLEQLTDTLICFNEASVVRGHGIVSVSTGVMLMARYPEDHKVVRFKPKDVLDAQDMKRREVFRFTGQVPEREAER